jgi:hypothetical protein
MTDLRKAAEMAVEALMGLDSHKRAEAVIALRQALAQEDKECVAIVNEGMGGIEWLSPPLPDDTPLYTAPLKPEWVGLTDQEIHEIVYEQMEGQHPAAGFRVANCIESKLKEKNT